MQVFYSKIVLSNREPTVTNVIWLKLLTGNKIAPYLFFNGKWEPFTIADGKDTPSTDDDTPYTPGEGGSIGPDEIAQQIEAHDISVGDTHNTSTTDTGDYPDVFIY